MVALAAVLWLRVYAGPEGQRVEVAKLADGALVRFTKTGSPHDGLVVRCTPEYATRFHGSEWTLLRLAATGKGTAWFPGVKEFPVAYLEDGAAQAADLLAEHERQRADGRLALFAKKEHPHLVRKYEAKAATALAELRKSCPAVTAFRFDWASFSDDDMDNHDVWALCASAVRCTPGVSELVCRRGAKRLEVRSGAQLVLEVAP